METFESAKLTWAWPTGSQSAGLRQLYCDLLAARKAWPAMRDFATRTARLCGDHERGLVLELVRGREEGDALRAYFNLSDTPAALPAKVDHSRAVLLTSESYRYAGDRTGAAAVTELRPFECIVIGPATWRRF